MTITPEELGQKIIELRAEHDRPVVVAIDGRSSAGKSTLAKRVVLTVGATVIEGDDFYSGGHETEWDQMTPAERCLYCIDWRRQRTVLRQLRSGQQAQWHPYDWSTTSGRRLPTPTSASPTGTILLEGVYTARPELHDLLDLTVLLDTAEIERSRRFNTRPRETPWTSTDDDRERWARRFGESEDHYFSDVMPPREFDLIVGVAESLRSAFSDVGAEDLSARES